MTEHLNGEIDELLTAHALQAREAEEKDLLTKSRATDAVHALISSTTCKVFSEEVRALDVSLSVDQRRKSTRTYMAAILSLLGKPAANVGHLDSASVVLARDVNRHNVVYSEVSVALSNVAIKMESAPSSDDISSIKAKTFKPDDITEGKAVLLAYQKDHHRPQVLDTVGAWVADHEMPDTYRGRENYVDPGKLGKVAATMIRAMSDADLNPGLYTLGFLSATNLPLAMAVVDHSVEGTKLHEHMVLPDWLQPAENAS